ncbi:MAG: phosphoenolpyruvate--protein phosphotransferase [Sedimenticola thiotaurini]|uniref:phosphoenolpyruvate--protein phosphotransferase n=1 Tax=Sedimenticola thiotaurini TaxID=1543721 RepID=A0A558DC05_9GAMM|nr:phosphoenolpyruvate--protein phosphotransferase [Sedimenticola sp.]TVT58508.1 MAG: phosphoenolpyruvate--protein phosphotransferase [Sedimenticola thiotaurini]
MLEILHRIVQEVNAAPDLGEALRLIVQRVKQAIGTDVCSVYLTDFDRREHVLLATEGLNPDAVGKVSLPMHRGLVGLVCERAEPVNLDDATQHPRYLFIHATGETQYRGFLGVPIIQNRKVLGVLVVRQVEPRKFDDDEVTFLFTLAAQLAGAITYAQASGELNQIQHTRSPLNRYLSGQPSAPGVATGQAVVAYQMADLDAVPDRTTDDPAAEIAALREAVDRTQQELKSLKERLSAELPVEEQALFDALLLMLGSDTLISQTIERIEQGQWAQGALHHTIEVHAKVFDNMDDVYLRERASDIRDLGRRVLMHLQMDKPREVLYPDKTILVGGDISAVQLAEVPIERLTGIVSAMGSSSSHVAILARAMGIPAVMGVTDLPVGRLEGLDVIIDGYRGRVYVTPDPSVRDEYARLAKEETEIAVELEAMKGLKAETTDGTAIPLYLNTGLISDVMTVGLEESEGVGLHRTELLYITRDRFPGEDVQVESYRQLLSSFNPRPVILRTLDIGGDKPLPYFPFTESNPFLGWRGVRISLDHPEIFLTQIRAMMRANIGLNNLQIMLPMVSMVSEVDELQMLIQRAYDELVEEEFLVSMPPVGVMIEVPAAVYQIDEIARRVDFLSVGTNDLTQYLLAVDRNNPRVADIFDDMHPAVLRAISQIVEGAALYRRPVSVCGELAGNPLAAILLLGMGINSLSMSGGSLLKIKWVIRSFSRARAKSLLQAALRMTDARQVRDLMEKALDDMGLGGLIRPGK